ncbi:hypothetical protein GCM10027168_64080 [Streptomyces capparidis]
MVPCAWVIDVLLVVKSLRAVRPRSEGVPAGPSGGPADRPIIPRAGDGCALGLVPGWVSELLSVLRTDFPAE